MNITINDALRSCIDPLTADEYAALERSLLAEGCRDALVLWGETLIDGHNRYAICRRHDIPFKTVHNTSFGSIDDVMLWMIDNHLARRSVSDFQRGVLALRKKDIVAAKSNGRLEAGAGDDAADLPRPALATREEVARAARVSSNTLGLIEKIQKAAAPELVEAVRSGTISINAAANVATLPQAEQVVAVAGGKKQLQQAAKEIREQRAASRPPREPKEADPADEGDASAGAGGQVAQLRAEIAALKARNASLQAENEALGQRIAVLIDAS
ncbi:MAG: hypothetical protein H7Z39_10345 [Burkholderiaceae bacterium]|nr:hypothetical protein [Burkholderiaceae bacterium]